MFSETKKVEDVAFFPIEHLTNLMGATIGSDDDDKAIPSSLPWQFASSFVMGLAGTLTRVFTHVPNAQAAHGLDEFSQLLDTRADPEKRGRGLITVSNHISVIDDPLLFGVLPFRYHWHPDNHRWALASHDICFGKFKALDVFWSLGQTLPTHRLHHSPHGGLFQPTMREAVRLLSQAQPHRQDASSTRENMAAKEEEHQDLSDPFSNTLSPYTYTTTGADSFPAPSAYLGRQYSWIHIFPEGKVHQHPKKTMRYFKWGVARLILEPDVCPDIVPLWIEGNEEIMHETRKWPRFLPRIGKDCAVWFGENVGGAVEGSVFHELRQRWKELVHRSNTTPEHLSTGILNEELKFGKDAVALREECAMEVRKAVLAVRRNAGLPDEDPKAGLVDTWREEGGKTEGRMKDDSIVRDT